MSKKKKRLSLGKLTVVSLDFAEQDKVIGGGVTYLTSCCTINMGTCIILPDGCYRTDTYQPGGTACP